MKACARCKVVQPLENYAVKRRVKSGRRSRCRPCEAEHFREWYNRDVHARRARVSRWRKENPCKNAAKSSAYAQKLRRFPLTKAQKQEIVAIYARSRRLKAQTGVEYQVDHIIPINHPLVCGLHVPWNLQVLPKVLNQKKSNLLSLDALTPIAVSCRHVD